jgi:hypothetical protein
MIGRVAMVFSFFKRKAEPKAKVEPYSFKEAFESLYAHFVEQNPADLEKAKEEFINLTGQFDDEHENFNVKMDDFRTWFVFFYNFDKQPYYMLAKIKDVNGLSHYHEPLSLGVASIFQITKIKGDDLYLKDLILKNSYKVTDSLHAISQEEGDLIQTTLFETASNEHSMSLSVISHPNSAKSFIQKRIKKLVKENKKNSEGMNKLVVSMLQDFMAMRYQLYKYKQVGVEKVYSENPLVKSGVNPSQ